MNQAKNGLKIFIAMTILTGLIYPLLITLIAQITMPTKANGSMIFKENHILGSKLIAQKFKNEIYFWPRPSAIDFDPLRPSGGSNLGPTSRTLKEMIKERAKPFRVSLNSIPSELLYASGSGLDPHVSLEAIYFQIDRVAKARSINDTKKLKSLIDSLAEGFNKRYVNVLILNLALDKQFPNTKL